MNGLDKVIVAVCFGGTVTVASLAVPLGYSKLTVVLVAAVFGCLLGWRIQRRLCG